MSRSLMPVALMLVVLSLLGCGLLTPTPPVKPTNAPSVGSSSPTAITIPTNTPPVGAGLLIINEPSDLNFTLGDFPVGWQLQQQEHKDGGYRTYFIKLDAVVLSSAIGPIVDSWVKVLPTVEDSQNEYLQLKQQKGKSFSLDAPQIGEDSFIYAGNGLFEAYFRTRNVLAKVTMYITNEGSLDGVKQWAEKLEAKIDRAKILGASLPPVINGPTPSMTPTPSLAVGPTITPRGIGPVSTPSLTLLPSPTATPSNVFVTTASTNEGRVGHSAVRLTDGRVLVAGGKSGIGQCEVYGTSEIFDPSVGSWNPAASMHSARADFTMTLLQDGKVLVAGGQDSSGVELNSAEMFDPESDTWVMTAAPMGLPRAYHAAARLLTGQVLIMGGYAYEGSRTEAIPCRDTAEIFDPSTATFVFTSELHQGRVNHSATLLKDGRVLVVGGLDDGAYSSAEIFDPAAGTFSPIGDLVHGRRNTDLTILPNGTALVRGGFGEQTKQSAELYDPATGSLELIQENLPNRYNHSAVSLNNGKVLITGGTSGREALDSAELYDPQTAEFTLTESMNVPRVDHVTVELDNGNVLVVGGMGHTASGCDALSSVEIYLP